LQKFFFAVAVLDASTGIDVNEAVVS